MICSQWTHAGFLTIIFCFSCSWNTCFLVWKSFSLLEEMEIFIVLSTLCLNLKKKRPLKCFEKSKRFHKCTVCYQNHQCQSLECRPPTVAKSLWTQSHAWPAEKHSICPALQSHPRTPGFFLWSSAFLAIHFRVSFTGVIFCSPQFYLVALTFYVVVSTVLCPKPHL